MGRTLLDGVIMIRLWQWLRRYPSALIVNDSFTYVAHLPRPGVYYHGLITIVLTTLGSPHSLALAPESPAGTPTHLRNKNKKKSPKPLQLRGQLQTFLT